MAAVKNRCVIVSASPAANMEFIVSRIRSDDFVICADGGADKLVDTGIVPDLIIGDLDSSENYGYFKDTKITELSVHKDDTDTMHCVQTGLDMGYGEFLLLGATGGRLDHTLANLSVLLYLERNAARGVIADEYTQTSLLRQGDNVINNICGKTVSVMPFACERAVLSYQGMYYPMNMGEVTIDYPYTISNKAVDDTVIVTLHSGEALLIISD